MYAVCSRLRKAFAAHRYRPYRHAAAKADAALAEGTTTALAVRPTLKWPNTWCAFGRRL